MIIVLKPHTSEENIQRVENLVKKHGLDTHLVQGTGMTIIGCIGDTTLIDSRQFEVDTCVDKVMHVLEPYKLANRAFHPEDSIIDVSGVKIGGEHLGLIAGPCSVESYEQGLEIAQKAKTSGANLLRGGAFKPRTSPYAFQGLGLEGLDILCAVREEVGLPIVTELMSSKYLDVFKKDGKIYGIPNSVQAMGITYNKTVIEKATGEKFDPSMIKSSADLAALCEKIQAGGVSPIMFTGVDWSLGSHYLSQVFSGVRGDADAQQAFINDVKSDKADLKTDATWNSVMDTFDIIAKYNYNAKDPLVGDTEVDGQAMAKGKVAMWFMGDWSWSYLKDTANAGDEYGIMPCPLTAGESDAINQELDVFPSKGYCIDKSQSDEAQQAAAKKLVQFLCFGDQQAMADLLGTALPYTNCNVTYSNPITQATQSYITSGKTASTYAFSMLLPSDFWSENGATMQQYLTGKMDRDKAADAIQTYWKNQK